MEQPPNQKTISCPNCGDELLKEIGKCLHCGGPYPIDTDPGVVLAKIHFLYDNPVPYEQVFQFVRKDSLATPYTQRLNRLASLAHEYINAGGTLAELQEKFNLPMLSGPNFEVKGTFPF